MVKKIIFIFALCCATTFLFASEYNKTKKESTPVQEQTLLMKEYVIRVPSYIPLTLDESGQAFTFFYPNGKNAEYLATVPDKWLIDKMALASKKEHDDHPDAKAYRTLMLTMIGCLKSLKKYDLSSLERSSTVASTNMPSQSTSSKSKIEKKSDK